MDYGAAVAYLESLIDYERTPAEARAARLFNLARMERLLERLGNPHKGLSCLHIAGTKGKGSTAAMAASILQTAGYRVGLYTSPHLVSCRERIRVDGSLISESEAAEIVGRLRPHLEAVGEADVGQPSFFEAYTAMAFLHFRKRGVDLAVLETGLGGRLDATNVIHPRACGITTIAFDHTRELGSTLAQIAAEKAGIIKPGVAVVCAPQSPEAMQVISAVCRERDSPLLKIGSPEEECDIAVKSAPPSSKGQRITIWGKRGPYEEIVCPLLGEHQAWNAGVAVGMVETLAQGDFQVKAEAIQEGLSRVNWPGRLQILHQQPRIILDGAHDEASAQALTGAVKALFPAARPKGRRGGPPQAGLATSSLTLILGVYRDKDVKAIAEALFPLAERVILTAAKSPRATAAEELREVVSGCFAGAALKCAPNVAAALETARAGSRKEDLILVTGSLCLVGEAMQVLGVSPW